MKKGYYVANTDYQLACVDSANVEVDLSGCSPACFFPVPASTLKADGKECLIQIQITITPATGVLKTSLVDGVAVTFNSATGFISGSSSKTSARHTPLLLADSDITPATINSYTGEGSIGTLIVIGTNVETGITVSDFCQVWIKDAGQNVLEVV